MKQKYKILMILVTTLILCFIFSFIFNPVIYIQPNDHKRWLKYSDHTESKEEFVPLPQSVIDGVKYFVYFVGRAHSGHSIVGSILDSHPHMIVGHKAKIFLQMKDNPARYSSKAAIFNELWWNSYNVSHYAYGLRSGGSRDIKNKGYTLQINGLHQGTYLSHVDVIGDKNGGHTTGLLNNDPLEWDKILNKLKSLINIPFKVIYVIRNPFDNIASAQLYNSKSFHMSSIRKSNETIDIKHDILVHRTKKYFAAHQAIMDTKQKYNLDLLEIHVKDLVEHPDVTITKLCNFLNISCSDSYIQGCSDTLFKTESKTRYKVKWTPDSISEVKKYILKYDNLIRYYSFDA